ncbi:hypothetical protein AB0M50_32930 [Nonomuraea fuscirosea]|uniref:hypothetical protein n=1 Tax=Nonomuraea fuscirosea TaxID=1291556 RepID=UPI002DDA0D74|nr:hypothetical protein [Nonomuraea fuscirosea]WSA50804.1 hypothetical protein OIE67_43185 [Nonomuraea fuscirosea]
MIEWLLSMAALFLVVYAATRLALKHDRRSRTPSPDEVADRELRQRLAEQRAAHLRDGGKPGGE